MKAGFAKVSILPPFTASLAGYGERMPRHYSHVLDEPQAKSLAVSDGDTGVVVIGADFLTPTDRLTQAVRIKAAHRLPKGVEVVLHGTHTHSAPGNYWNHPIAVRMCGPYSTEGFEFLADRFAESAVRAWEARVESRTALDRDADSLAYLQENRRRADGPIDPVLTAMGFHDSKGAPIGCVVQFAGHPVIVAERDFYAVSADYPGRVGRILEREYPVCVFLNGAVGGLSIWFPETPIDVHDHLRRVSDPIAGKAADLLSRRTPIKTGVGFSRQEVALPPNGSKPIPPGYLWWEPVLRPAVWYWNRVASTNYPKERTVTVSALRIGDAAFVFQASDFGVGGGLRTRANGDTRGLATCPVGHTDDYIGYIHPVDEMMIHPKPGKDFREMTIYENLMGFYGRGVYDLMERAECRALDAAIGH